MKSEANQEFLKGLASKRKILRWGLSSFLTYLDITPAERTKLYELARQRGLLTCYEFSGIKSFGINRNDAARMMLQKTRDRAFEKLKIEFGAEARFWVNPKQLCGEADFYWRLAKLGVVISGPLLDDLSRGDPMRGRDSRTESKERSVTIPGVNSWNFTLLSFPYYLVWHHPSDFLNRIKRKLVASGCYPRLQK